MRIGREFLRRPQNVWVRKALFQIHLWTGIGVGLYILMISLSGSAIVFRREITRLAWSVPRVTPTGRAMTVPELSAAVKKAYPRFDVARVTLSSRPDRAAEVLLTRGQRGRRERVFDPYTGKDLGDIAPDEPRLLSWLVRLHDDLLADHKGRFWNGIGAILLTALSLTGIVIWWPGLARWWRSLILSRHVGWARFNWDLHSALGFWMFAFVLMWGVSGIYLSLPQPFSDLVDYLQPIDAKTTELRAGDEFLAWLARIHFGRAYGTSVKWLYTILGLVPAVLFVTGAIMWWNRVLRPAMRRNEQPAAASLRPEVSNAGTPDFTLET